MVSKQSHLAILYLRIYSDFNLILYTSSYQEKDFLRNGSFKVEKILFFIKGGLSWDPYSGPI